MFDWVAPTLLSNRLDCHRYQSNFVHAEARLRRSGVPVAALASLRDPKAPINNSLRDMTHALVDKGVPVIRGTNITPPWVLASDLLFLDPAVEAHSARSRVKHGDIIICIAGSLGVTGLVPEELADANINSSCARFRASDPDLAYFLAIYLASDVGQAVLLRESVGSVQRHLNLEDLPELIAPVPPAPIRHAIACKLRKAEYLRREARELLSGAETEMESLLTPATTKRRARAEDYELLCRTPSAWITGLRSLSDRRLDAAYYEPRYLDALNRLRSLPLEVKELRDICAKVNCGATPKKVAYGDGGLGLIRTSNIRPNCFDDSDLQRVPDMEVRPDSNVAILPGDVLYTMSGSVGYTAVYPAGYDLASCSNTVARARVRDREQADPYYVALFLNSSLGRAQSLRLISGGVLAHVMPNSVKRLLIALPDIERQREIGGRLRLVEQHRRDERALVASARADVDGLIAGTLKENRLFGEGQSAEDWLAARASPKAAEGTRNARRT